MTQESVKAALARALKNDHQARAGEGHLACAQRVVEQVRASTGEALPVSYVQGLLHAQDGDGGGDTPEDPDDVYDDWDAVNDRLDAQPRVARGKKA